MLKGASLVLITGFPINWKCRSRSLRQIKVRVISRSPSLSLSLLHLYVLIVFYKPRGARTNPSAQHNHHQHRQERFRLPHKRLPSDLESYVSARSSRGIRVAQLLKPPRTFLQNSLVNLRLITCQSVSTKWRRKAEHGPGVEVVEFIDLIKTAETGQTLQVFIQHLFTGERSISLWISALQGRERV